MVAGATWRCALPMRGFGSHLFAGRAVHKVMRVWEVKVGVGEPEMLSLLASTLMAKDIQPTNWHATARCWLVTSFSKKNSKTPSTFSADLTQRQPCGPTQHQQQISPRVADLRSAPGGAYRKMYLERDELTATRLSGRDLAARDFRALKASWTIGHLHDWFFDERIDVGDEA